MSHVFPNFQLLLSSTFASLKFSVFKKLKWKFGSENYTMWSWLNWLHCRFSPGEYKTWQSFETQKQESEQLLLQAEYHLKSLEQGQIPVDESQWREAVEDKLKCLQELKINLRPSVQPEVQDCCTLYYLYTRFIHLHIVVVSITALALAVWCGQDA